jgi:hypothetical protein
MLPRLNYHDYRRVCDERSEAVAQSLLFAEEEPGASMPGMKAARPRPSLPMMGIDAVRTDPSLHAKFNAAKVAASERKRAHRLARLKDVRDRSDSLIYDRINEVGAIFPLRQSCAKQSLCVIEPRTEPSCMRVTVRLAGNRGLTKGVGG